jgi:hypothetical protein
VVAEVAGEAVVEAEAQVGRVPAVPAHAGHEDPRITMEFYAHLSPGYLRNAIDRLAINPGEPEIEVAPVATMATVATPSEPADRAPFAAPLLQPFETTDLGAHGDSENRQPSPTWSGAGYRVRTDDIQLGKLTLYQLS